MTFVETKPPSQTKLNLGSAPAGVLQIVLMYALQLRQELCEAFILCDVQGCSIAEAAGLLLINSDSVTKNLKKARRQMEGVLTRILGATPGSLS